MRKIVNILLEWRKCRGVFLNIRFWTYHLHVWCWGIRFIKAESGRNILRLDEIFIWRPNPQGRWSVLPKQS